MLTHLVMARSALGTASQDLSQHAAFQCRLGELKHKLLDTVSRISGWIETRASQ